MNKINFTKMHGCANDYIYLDCMDGSFPADIESLAVEMSRRHFSVGSDGVVCICKPDSPENDAKMRMFNADGSEGKMCGNAIRCVGKFLSDRGYVTGDKVNIETLSGTKYLTLTFSTPNNGEKHCTGAVVDMGKAVTECTKIPVIHPDTIMINHPITVQGKQYNITAVSMGNPHAVVFLDESPKSLEIEKIGPHFESHEIFPERVNTEFIYPIDRATLEMRVWERGSGETYACGTGACAAVVAAVLNGLCEYNTPITVKLIGGDLVITVAHDLSVKMEGSATLVYDGVYYTK